MHCSFTISSKRSVQSDRAYTFLLALLRLALGENVQNMPMALSPDEWREVYRMAAKHAVIAIAWDGVEQLQQHTPQMLQSMPADLMGKWFADVHAIEAANSRMAKHTAQVQKLLSDGGFDSLVLKGATLAAYYSKPEHRQAAWGQAFCVLRNHSQQEEPLRESAPPVVWSRSPTGSLANCYRYYKPCMEAQANHPHPSPSPEHVA